MHSSEFLCLIFKTHKFGHDLWLHHHVGQGVLVEHCVEGGKSVDQHTFQFASGVQVAQRFQPQALHDRRIAFGLPDDIAEANVSGWPRQADAPPLAAQRLDQAAFG